MAKKNYIPLRSSAQKPNPQNAIKQATFILAFVPDAPSANLSAWSTRATVAIDALIRLRSLAHKWAAARAIDETELAAVYEAMAEAGLSDWLDDTLGGGK